MQYFPLKINSSSGYKISKKKKCSKLLTGSSPKTPMLVWSPIFIYDLLYLSNKSICLPVSPSLIEKPHLFFRPQTILLTVSHILTCNSFPLHSDNFLPRFPLLLKHLFTSANIFTFGFPWWLNAEEPTCNAGDMRDTGLIPGSERSLGEGVATHTSILAWRIPWTEEPGRLQSMESQRVRHDWAINTHFCYLFLLINFKPHQFHFLQNPSGIQTPNPWYA